MEILDKIKLQFLKTNKKAFAFLLIGFVLIISGCVFWFFWQKNSLVQKEIKESQNKVAQLDSFYDIAEPLPKDNLTIFTRCQGDIYAPHECTIFAYQLFRPGTEQKLYKHQFKYKNGDDRLSNRLTLVNYYQNKLVVNEEDKDLHGLYILDLVSKEKKKIEIGDNNYLSATFNYQLNPSSRYLYIKTNHKQDLSIELLQYDMETGDIKSIYRAENVRDVNIYYFDDQKIYLEDSMMGIPTSDYSVNLILNLSTMAVENISPIYNRPVFSSDGKKVARIKVNTVSNVLESQSIVLSDIDGSNTVELFKTPVYDKRVAFDRSVGDGIDYHVHTLLIAPAGNRVVSNIVKNGSNTAKGRLYRWGMGMTSDSSYMPKGGLVLLPQGPFPVQSEYKMSDETRNYLSSVYSDSDLRIWKHKVVSSAGNYLEDNLFYNDKNKKEFLIVEGDDFSKSKPLILGVDQVMVIP